ncbi:MAG: 4Fe-4S binding protein [Candidatus Competibacteraceae bacterium]
MALITLLFVDFERIGATPVRTVVLYPQFVPSLLKFTQTATLAASGFLVVLALTLLFGRVYCSMFCPLGVLQDIVIRLADKFRKPRKVKFKYSKPNDTLRYGMLALAAGLFLSGNALALTLLDPFSNYGRIASDVLRPLYVAVHNGIGQGLEAFGIYALFPLQWKAPPLATWAFPALFLVGLIWMSVIQGRLFCNTLCPVGALLGLVSRFALFKIQIPKDACIVCAQCSIHCKASCIRLKTKEVDFSRCVACFDCITVCEAHGIGYARSELLKQPEPKQEPAVPNRRRRALLRGAAVMLLGWAGWSRQNSAEAKPHNRNPTQVINRKTWPVVAPGAHNFAHFNNRCTACHLCVSACPTGVLQPSLLNFGLSGLLQPHLDYETNYCSYECNLCGQVCPTGALLPLTLSAKQTTQLGVAHFVRDNCIVYTDRTACGACDEHCPTKAVHMVPYQDGLTIPEVREALCIGCGACENACPARPHRAIYVDGHPVHQLAQKPESRRLEQEVKSEFPF